MKDYYLTGAYGRTYATARAMIEAWKDGRDFRIVEDGPYTSIRDEKLIKDEGRKIFLYQHWPHIKVEV